MLCWNGSADDLTGRTSPISPKELVREWVLAFNSGDAERVGGFYADDAINHQVASEPVLGRTAITEMFVSEFASATMTCEVENLF